MIAHEIPEYIKCTTKGIKFLAYFGHSYFNACMMRMTDIVPESRQIHSGLHTKGIGGTTLRSEARKQIFISRPFILLYMIGSWAVSQGLQNVEKQQKQLTAELFPIP